MRTTFRSIQLLVLAALLALAGSSTRARADERADAKAHYQSGTKLYAAGNYKDAVREFAAAEQLVPSGYNDYNLALCYDKLGDAEPAIKYYRSYLARVPDAANKSVVDASIARLDSAAKAVADKASAKAASEKAAADKAAAAKAAADAAAKAAADQQAAAEKAAADAAAKAAADQAAAAAAGAAKQPVAGVQGPAGAPPMTGLGSTGTPGTAAVQPTGDAQLDQVASIDVNRIRDERTDQAGNGLMVMRGSGPSDVGPAAGPIGQPTSPAGPPPTAPGQPADKPKDAPLYKKWWFWVLVAAGAFIVYDIATSSSSSNNNSFGRVEPLNGTRATEAPGGYTLLHW